MDIKDLKQVADKSVVITDEQGNIIYVNAKFTERFGWQESEALGESVCIIIPAHLRDAHNLGFSRFLSSGQSTIMNQALALAAVDKAGNEFNAEHYIIAEQIDGAWQIGATIE